MDKSENIDMMLMIWKIKEELSIECIGKSNQEIMALAKQGAEEFIQKYPSVKLCYAVLKSYDSLNNN